MTPGPAEEWFKGCTEAVHRADKAIARARVQAAFAEGILIDLYSIRDRLATMEREASELAARFRAN
jgi:hypothetical protein